ncbi:DUF1861 family protein [Paenibacillus motobuensis]|uniref:DUF1861 family protein n=1 Tax=Paenibacillus TaxID=44249 RepID=UPI00203E9BF2|nr:MULTISPECIES: DUF1861 family protein [Paenibacillus]MCM3042133.1 DUF1861 family protein [Paenibacillus lutimineralis]MCM3649237.1 DUF1861 family protein [Paenibacillus motobuensis]
MNLIERREHFEMNKSIYESAKLTFYGVEGYDVYNVSIPFQWKGREYIFGRMERRSEWARSWVRLYEKTGKDQWTLVPDSMIYPLEDPYITLIGNTLVMGGTHVRYQQNSVDTYFGYFYKGTEIDDLHYFTTGPEYMKDIRLVEMDGGRIGVFSRPRSEEIRRTFGSESMIGFTVINSLDELTMEVVENAPYIYGLFEQNEWGGCNQAYYLDSGNIGVIGHICYKTTEEDGGMKQVYMNFSFVLDVAHHVAMDQKIIGTRTCYPDGPAKKPELTDCAFSSGIVMREDGKCDLYSGIGDTEAGRIVIDYPFAGYGNIISK